ncbi:ABC transporter ATP-binding protein [Bdellovibrio reynosensis]|uniref:ABC transporter ATP-binding protein n=1 Tax=Bdellovibrio reynosensis TaxID=2835041 RepID=A0ABY4CEL8_9BACT|nr:ABC transporter ATP-binding protein [Bdellovibrio reynosensis]UOF01993.1 ABC transporter ATP-binding protein [Bdellovibrio reynosensis]
MEQALGIKIKTLSKSFGSKTVIKDLSVEITPGSFVTLLGPSGCGKSTLLRLIAGLDNPTVGELALSPSGKKKFGFVFQEANLLPWKTVKENVSLPFELDEDLKSISKPARDEKVFEALRKVKLEGSENLFPHELSGGMKMRVSIARALVSNPRLLLMDEPFAALDENTRFEMQDQLLQLWETEKMTVVFVTHSLYEASYLSQRVIMLKAPGAIISSDMNLALPPKRNLELRTSEAFNSVLKELTERFRS